MKRIIEISGDGSHTLYVPELDEHYHSTKGAIREAMHVFIEAGLKKCPKNEIHLLEIGFGTALNAFLTLIDTEKSGKKVNYTAIEKFPLDIDEVSKLNYTDMIAPDREETFRQLHTLPWDEWMDVSPGFRLNKMLRDVTQLDEFQPHTQFDVIYFDAFGPAKQPEMWTQEIFQRIYTLSNDGAILTTYCAKGAVRRMLVSIGYHVERLPGPPGKREMLRAIK